MNSQYFQNQEQAEDALLIEMQAAETIWGQLNSDAFRKGFNNSQGSYEDWRARATDAYSHKRRDAKELIDYIAQRWGVHYKSSQQLRRAIAERNLMAPDWLEPEPALDNIPAADLKAAEVALAEIAKGLEPEKPPFELSVEGQELLWNILNRLKESRLACKMSMTQVASFWGYTGQAVSNWESGETPITLVNILKLSQIYNVAPIWILTGDDYLDPRALAELALGLQANLDSLKQIMGD